MFIIDNVDDELLNDLKNDPNVLAVEENQYYYPTEATAGQNPPEWSHIMSGIHEFWARGYRGQGVKVGVIDTGFGNHEDIVYTERFSPWIDHPAEEDMHPHGTNVAGIIGAKDNNKGYVGVAPEVELYCAKACESTWSFSSDAIYSSINWLIGKGVKIINCSYGGVIGGESDRRVYETAYRDHGVLFVCSAGNEASIPNTPDPNNCVKYPAAYPFTLAVGSISPNRVIADYSSRGPEVDISAPGDGVMAPKPTQENIDGTDFYGISNRYELFGGTSCAAPHITGMAALYKQMYPNYTADQLKAKILEHYDDFGVPGKDIMYGVGCAISPWTAKTASAVVTISRNQTMSGIQLQKNGYAIMKYVATVTERVEMAVKDKTFGSFYRFVTNDKGGKIDTVGDGYLDVEAGKTYYIVIYAANKEDYGTFSFYVGEMLGSSFGTAVLAGTGFSSSLNVMYFPNREVYFNFVPATTGRYRIRTFLGTGLSAEMRVYDSGKYLLTYDRNSGTNGNPQLDMQLTAAKTYYMKLTALNTVDYPYGPAGTYITKIDDIPGDTFETPIVLSGSSTNGNIAHGSQEVYFKFVPTRSGVHTFTTSSSIDLRAYLYDANRKQLDWNDDGGGNLQPKIDYNLTAGQTYYIKINAYGSSTTGSFTLNISQPATGNPPGTPSLTVGSPTTNSLTLTYSASGAASYDIYRNGARIATDRTSTTFTDTGLSPGTTYSYYVVAKNAYGSTTSATKSGTTSSGVTPTTRIDDFESDVRTFDYTYTPQGNSWNRQKLNGDGGSAGNSNYCMSTVTSLTTIREVSFSVDVPVGATTSNLKFDYTLRKLVGDSMPELTVLVNRVKKFSANTLTDWKNSGNIALGTGKQTITFSAKSLNSDTGLSAIDNLTVSWA
ncbi:S8 family serine peptidase [Brevibacillus massiliensis]|uniref:S8 family serine peptidase n=1 Tax=Brevibacillus massiliensis TaxID=1118054 RepID=UPI00037CF485|nr:S8 family serine peptidase [Brevibacillus massiliensis]